MELHLLCCVIKTDFYRFLSLSRANTFLCLTPMCMEEGYFKQICSAPSVQQSLIVFNNLNIWDISCSVLSSHGCGGRSTVLMRCERAVWPCMKAARRKRADREHGQAAWALSVVSGSDSHCLTASLTCVICIQHSEYGSRLLPPCTLQGGGFSSILAEQPFTIWPHCLLLSRANAH